MSVLKFRFPLALPRRDSGEVLPAALVALLAAMTMTQLLLSAQAELPASGGVGFGAARFAAPLVAPVEVPAEIMARPLFAPRLAPPQAGGGQATASAIGGAVIAGSISIRGRSRILIRHPDGRVAELAPGGTIAGWRLLRIGRTGVSLARDGKRIEVAFGAAAPAEAAPAQEGNGE